MSESRRKAIDLQERAMDSPTGGVALFASRKASGKTRRGLNRLAAALESSGLAVLRVELAAGNSSSGQAASDKSAIGNSVKSAIEQLAEECGENHDRIAVLAEGEAANSAVLGARTQRQVRSFVLLSGRLSNHSKGALAEWRDNPALCLVSSEDRKALRDMSDVYFASKHPDTDIRVFEGMGNGAEMITTWAERLPVREPLEHMIANWLREQFSSFGRAREVSFMTEDGWQIFGNLLLPDLNDERAPGVILLHSGRSDRYVFSGLEQLLVRAGFAVLNIDWRGRGKSVNQGKYFDLSKEERANGKLDAKAAIDFLASRSEVDPQRIALVGIIHGAEHAVRGSIGDVRVKALVLLTGYVPIAEREQSYLTSGKVHVFYTTCTGHRHVTETMRRLYEATPDKLARLLIYEGGAIGYQLFELDDKFEPTIVEWLKEGLAQ